MGLNDTFNVMRSSILMKSHLPSIGQVYSLLLQEETQRKICSTSHFMTDSASLNVNSFGFNNHGSSSSQSITTRKSNYGTRKSYCNYCKKACHRIEKCFKLLGFRDDLKFTKSKRVAAQVEVSEQPVSPSLFGASTSASSSSIISTERFPQLCSQILKLLKTTQTSKSVISNANFTGNLSILPYFIFFYDSSNKSWILKNGASDHMCSYKPLFSSLSILSQPLHITLPNGQIISISHVGNVPITHNIIMKDVLYVPNFKINLLFISKLTQQLNYTIQFTHDTCYLQGHS